MACMLFTFESSPAHALGGVSEVASVIIIDEQLPLVDYASWGLSSD